MNLRDRVLSYLYDKRSATVEEIANALQEEVDYVQATLRVLENEKLVRKTQKGLIFKKTVYELTPTGLEEASKAYEKLKEKANQLQNMILQGDEIPQEFADLLPLMLTLSLIEATMLQDIMLFDIFNNM
mgnify:CR=1 FL=1